MLSLRLLIFLLLSTTASGSYDFNDPYAKHTDQAILFDGQGRKDAALLSFRAAVKFKPDSDSYTNLGVCLMRMRKYYEAYNAMSRANNFPMTNTQRAHVEENVAALKQSMQVEGLSIPDGNSMNNGNADAQLETPKRRRRRKKPQESQPRRTRVYREELVHQRDIPLAPPLPRVSIHEIDNDDRFINYRNRKEPFILTDAVEDWGAFQEWPDSWQDTLPVIFPHAVADFYPYNMLDDGRHSPFLTRLPRAAKEVMMRNGDSYSKFKYEQTSEGRYMHLQLTPDMWTELEQRGDIRTHRHWHLNSDDWLASCLDYPDGHLAEEYHLKTHWKIILTGQRGAGMFNHSDSLMTSSWHAHLMGRKWWYVCGNLLNGSHACFEDYVDPGETLYYGHGWHHETQNLKTPTMTITDTVAHGNNFEGIADQLHATCAYNKHSFDLSAELCDALDTCYEDLYLEHRNAPKPSWRWKPWRELASDETIRKRTATRSHHNNYDGRNYITE